MTRIEECKDVYRLVGVGQSVVELPKTRGMEQGDVLEAGLLFACFDALYEQRNSPKVGNVRALFSDWLLQDWLVTSTLVPNSREKHSQAYHARVFGTNDVQRIERVLEWISGKKPLFWYGQNSRQVAFGRDGDLYVSLGGLEQGVGLPCFGRTWSL